MADQQAPLGWPLASFRILGVASIARKWVRFGATIGFVLAPRLASFWRHDWLRSASGPVVEGTMIGHDVAISWIKWFNGKGFGENAASSHSPLIVLR
jgi:hypothetical protein